VPEDLFPGGLRALPPGAPLPHVPFKRMDTIYHDIVDHRRPPERVLEVPAVSFSSQWIGRRQPRRARSPWAVPQTDLG